MTFEDAAKRKRDLINQAKASAKGVEPTALVKPQIYAKPEDVESRIRLIFDNSGSMGVENIANAKKGVVEFLRYCRLNLDAVAIHLLENPYSLNDDDESTALTVISRNIVDSVLMTDLTMLASNVDSPALRATGGTPLFNTILEALKAKPVLTRMVAFSDGEPNFDDRQLEPAALAKAREMSIPIDTVFFGAENTTGAKTMKRIADATGGIYLVFDPAKGVNFASAFKYLAPTKRLMLMDKSFAEKLQKGEVK